jgi:hypothetical protein
MLCSLVQKLWYPNSQSKKSIFEQKNFSKIFFSFYLTCETKLIIKFMKKIKELFLLKVSILVLLHCTINGLQKGTQLFSSVDRNH